MVSLRSYDWLDNVAKQWQLQNLGVPTERATFCLTQGGIANIAFQISTFAPEE